MSSGKRYAPAMSECENSVAGPGWPLGIYLGGVQEGFSVSYETPIQIGGIMGKRTAKSRRTMTQLRADRDVRRRESLRLRQEGHTLQACAEALGVSVPTVSSDLVAMGVESGDKHRRRAAALMGLDGVPVPEPSKNGAHGDTFDWQSLKTEQIDQLRRRAASGVVSAQVALVRLAVSEADKTSCDDHIPASDVQSAVSEICDAYATEFRGSFLRSLEAQGIVSQDKLRPYVDISLGRTVIQLQAKLNVSDSSARVMT